MSAEHRETESIQHMPKSEITSPLAPLVYFLIDVIKVTLLTVGCLFGILLLFALLYLAFKLITEEEAEEELGLQKKGDEETACGNHEEVNCNEERRDKEEDN